jgi:flotillin
MINVETELTKIGLELINVNVQDITDESGYIEALGKKAAAEATSQASIQVANQEKLGAIGRADADREREVQVADLEKTRDVGKAAADRERRVEVAKAEATAVEGENEAAVTRAESESKRREAVAEANRAADVAERTKKAAGEEEAYAAEQKAEQARAQVEEARQKVEIVVPAEIAKEKQLIDAEANKQQAIRAGEADGAATTARMEGEAEGVRALLSKQAEGLKQLVEAAGGEPQLAVQYLIANKLEDLVRIQVEAIKGIKIDKVTVWDSGGSNGNGDTATSHFLSNMMHAIPPLAEVFKSAGMDLPAWMGQVQGGAADVPVEPETPSAEVVVAGDGAH